MDDISKSRISSAHPQFISRVQQLDTLLLADPNPVDFRWTEVVRSWAQQASDYAEGRTAPPPPAKKITNAPPGHSWHQYGFAGDGCPMVNGEPDWDIEGLNWQKVYASLAGIGLFSGRNFIGLKGDDDHIQLVEIPESPTAEDVQVLQEGGMGSVWEKYFPVTQPATPTA